MRYDEKADALAFRNRLKAKVMFSEKVDGILFTFEKRPCKKDWGGRYTWGCDRATFVGGSMYGKRVSLCKHLLPTFNVESWARDSETVRHIGYIWERARVKVRKAMLANDALTRKGDAIYEEHRWGETTHTLKITNLTRAQAVHIYRMADAIIREG